MCLLDFGLALEAHMAVQQPKEYLGVLDWGFLVLVVARLYLFIHPYVAYI